MMDVPDDLVVSESTILGTHTFTGVLYHDGTETPVDITTGEPPQHSKVTVEDAKAFANRHFEAGDKPYVAKATSVETQIETQSAPYSACVFHHLSLVGGMDMHKSFSAVWDSPAYDVDVDADYQNNGTLTITVQKIS
jgi:hypothetical protein